MQRIATIALVAGASVALAACGSNKAPDNTAASPAAPAPADTSSAPAAAAPTAASTGAGASGAPAAFAICTSCHSVTPGQTLVGPSLAGVYGRASASLPGYSYSDALKGVKVTWSDDTLDKWLTNPAAMAPGTRMTYAGMSDAAQRQTVIAYLKTLK